jgi:hypothetical protein
LPSLPIAAFLAGALLTILLPVALLTALGIWYWIFAARAPATTEASKSSTDPAAVTAGPRVTPNLPHDPGV